MDRAIYPDKRYDAYRQELHVQKVKTMKPSVDISPPPTYSHLESRRKQIELEKQRLAKIAHENAKLTRALVEISTKPSKFPTQQEPQKKSLNREYRQREAERIQAENLAMIKRMIDKPPAFGTTNWEDERAKQLKYLQNCCEFPVLDHHQKIGAKVKKRGDTAAAQATQKLTDLSLNESSWPSATKKRVSPSPKGRKGSESPSTKKSPKDDEEEGSGSDDEKESSGSVALSDSEDKE